MELGKHKYITAVLRILSLVLLGGALLMQFSVCIFGVNLGMNSEDAGVEYGQVDLKNVSLAETLPLNLKGMWQWYPDVIVTNETYDAFVEQEVEFKEFPVTKISDADVEGSYRIALEGATIQEDMVLYIPNFTAKMSVFLNGEEREPVDERNGEGTGRYAIYELSAMDIGEEARELILSIEKEDGQLPLLKKDVFLTTEAKAYQMESVSSSVAMFLFGIMILLLISGSTFMLLLPGHHLISLITLFDSAIMLRLIFGMKEIQHFFYMIFPRAVISDSLNVSLQILFLMVGGVVGCFLASEIFDPQGRVPKVFTKPLPWMYFLFAIVFSFQLEIFDRIGVPVIMTGYAYTFGIVCWQYVICLSKKENRTPYYAFQIIKTSFVGILVCYDIFTLNRQANLSILMLLYTVFFFAHLFVRLYDNNRSYHQVALLNVNLEKTVAERTQELSEANRRLSALTKIDPLTQAYNRLYFEQMMETCLSHTEEGKLHLSMFDLDFFKKINDKFGHDAGDEQLIDVVRIVKNRIENKGSLSRLGGEEFAILFVGISAQEAKDVLEDIRQALERETKRDEKKTTASFGVVTYVSSYTQKDFLKEADRRLYLAKEQGRNRIVGDEIETNF